MTWSMEGSDRDDGYEAILTLHFETLGDATELLLQHSQLPEGSLSMYRAGWESVLAALQGAVLTGIGPNADSPPDDLDSAAETAFQKIVDVLSADPEVTTGRMLVSRGIKIRGKVFALRSAQNLVVKLPAAQIARLIESGCGVPFRSGSRVLKQ